MKSRIVNFKDIASHPNMSLSAKDYIENVTIEVDSNLATQLEEEALNDKESFRRNNQQKQRG